MFKHYEDEKLRAQVALSRHITLRVLIGAFFGFALLFSLIAGVTYYNVQALKVPVSYNHTDVHNTQYERGGQNGENSN
jgi:hypothetical protein